MCTNSQSHQANTPGETPAPTEIGDRGVASDGREVAEIVIAEVTEWLVPEATQDVLDRMRPLLHRDLRHTGE